MQWNYCVFSCSAAYQYTNQYTNPVPRQKGPTLPTGFLRPSTPSARDNISPSVFEITNRPSGILWTSQHESFLETFYVKRELHIALQKVLSRATDRQIALPKVLSRATDSQIALQKVLSRVIAKPKTRGTDRPKVMTMHYHDRILFFVSRSADRFTKSALESYRSTDCFTKGALKSHSEAENARYGSPQSHGDTLSRPALLLGVKPLRKSEIRIATHRFRASYISPKSI
jgi:hypothetical protein